MTTGSSKDLFEKIKEFQHTVLAKKPDRTGMMHEMRLMNFKVKPLTGEVANLDFSNDDFVGALWSLGKLDEFFRKEFGTLEDEEREVFFRLVDELRWNFQQQLNSAGIGAESLTDTKKNIFEVEIIKDPAHSVN